MRKLIIFILLAPLFYSCYHENQVEVQKPERLLSKTEMVAILTDVQLAEGALTYRRTRRIDQQNFRKLAYQQIFSTYGITAQILNDNINYYNNDPGNMELIYEEVLAKLSRMEGELKESENEADTVKTHTEK